jgi:hypothetical protein
MLFTHNLGDSTTTTTGALTARGVGDLEDVYVTIGGPFGTGTAVVEISFNGTNFVLFDSTTTTEKTVGPLPKCRLVRGNTSAHSGTGTISYRLGGNRPRVAKLMVAEIVSGAGTDILSGTADDSGEINLSGCGPGGLWLKSANWVGTYVVKISFDGGNTWGIFGSPVTVASGATSTQVALPRCSHVKVVATTNTSGTLSTYYGAHREVQI